MKRSTTNRLFFALRGYTKLVVVHDLCFPFSSNKEAYLWLITVLYNLIRLKTLLYGHILLLFLSSVLTNQTSWGSPLLYLLGKWWLCAPKDKIMSHFITDPILLSCYPVVQYLSICSAPDLEEFVIKQAMRHTSQNVWRARHNMVL